MIKIVLRKRNIHPQLTRINRIDDDNADGILQFEELYGDYKNFYGKISAYEFICKDKYLHVLIEKNDKKKIKDFIAKKINTIQQSAKNLNISSKTYHYLSEEQINNLLQCVDEAKTVKDAINHLYQICLYSDGLNIQ